MPPTEVFPEAAAMPEEPAKKLYEPTMVEMESSLLAGFVQLVQKHTGEDFGPYGEDCYKNLHQWSIDNKEKFWDLAWDFCGIEGEKGDVVIEEIDQPPYFRFFPNGKISYAENMLKYWLEHPEEQAVIYRHQDGEDRIWTGQQLCEEVSRWEQALRHAGVEKGDKVGMYLTNTPETAVLLIAASNIGAPLVTAGMEMGGDDMIERFGRVKPKVLITADSYTHGQKVIDRTDVIARTQREIPSIEKTVLVPSTAGTTNKDGLENTVTEEEFRGGFEAQEIVFNRHEFNHPIYIPFSSGTTGEPKGFIHSTGGILLKHITEYKLQADIKEGQKIFYHATPSWMMWNWLVSGLMAGATVMQHDGDPATPDASSQLRFTAMHGCQHHGTSAAVIQDIWMANDVKANGVIDFPTGHRIYSTGGVCPELAFEYIMEHVDPNVKICSITGGTDFVGVSIGGSSFMPVYAGCLQAYYLGMDIKILNDEGQPVQPGEAGELVIDGPHPSAPVAFVDDDEACSLYNDAYYDHFRDQGLQVWRHGDSICMTHEGQIVVIGRSDGTLNQNDVRIGPIKIYKQLTKDRIGDWADLIKGYTAVDYMTPQQKPKTILFLEMENWQDGVPEDMEKAIKKAIKDNVGPYSIPTKIMAVPAVLKTKNGKLAEVVTKKIINGKTPQKVTIYGEDNVAHYECVHQELEAAFADSKHQAA